MKPTPLVALLVLLFGFSTFVESAPNGTAIVNEPSSIAQNIDSGNIKICLNENDGDCDFPMAYAGQPNSEVLLKIPLSGEMTVNYYIENVIHPGQGDAIISGNDTGIWIKAKNGTWGHMRNPMDGRTFADYVTLEHITDDLSGDIFTVFRWEIPAQEGLFGVASNLDITQFSNRENMHWQIRLRVAYTIATDMDGNIETTGDWIFWQTDENGNPEYNETIVELATHNPHAPVSDWRFVSNLPYLYLERKAETSEPTEPPNSSNLSDEMVAVMAVITTMLLN